MAVQSLKILEGKVNAASLLIDWLQRLKLPAGGFKAVADARVTNADLTATYYGLFILDKMI